MNAPRLRILFAGTPDFSVPTLEALIDSGRTPVAVLTQPDRPSGRGRKVRPGPVKRRALECGIPVLQPGNLKEAAIRHELAALEPDLMVVVAYGLILPQAVLDIPRHGCWNIHGSLLPRWRGAAPIQRAVEAGDQESGVCIMHMEAGLDTGPVYHRAGTPIAPAETGGSLHDRLATMGAEALVHCIGQLESGTLPEPEPQDDDQATYAGKLQKSEALIDWTESAESIERRIRAFNPWPVAWCEIGGERLRVWRAELTDEAVTGEPGSLVGADDRGIGFNTGHGVLRLTEVQRPGGRAMPAADFLRAHPLPADG